jgi:hypothetical protein
MEDQRYSEFLPVAFTGARTTRVLTAVLPTVQATKRPWYLRHVRILTSLGLLAMALVALSFQSGLADSTLKTLVLSFNLHTSPQSLSTMQRAAPKSPSQALVRLYQIDPNQYATRAEFDLWAYSACSAASMTEVFNAWGRDYRITDVLKVEYEIGEISPSLGLLRPEGIANTATKFGFKTEWGTNWTLDKLLGHANAGRPAIVSFPPSTYAGGHLLVVIGGDDSNVYLADSSGYNRKSLTRGQFLAWWRGYAAVVTPNPQS